MMREPKIGDKLIARVNKGSNGIVKNRTYKVIGAKLCAGICSTNKFGKLGKNCSRYTVKLADAPYFAYWCCSPQQFRYLTYKPTKSKKKSTRLELLIL